MSAGAPRSRRYLIPLELKLQAVLNCLIWMIGPKLRSSVSTVLAVHPGKRILLNSPTTHGNIIINVPVSLTHTAVVPLPGRWAHTSIPTTGEVHETFAIMKTGVHGTAVD